MTEDREKLDIVYLWDNLLSRNPEHILRVFIPLDQVHQKNILDHLIRMIHDPGWHPEQRRSAQSALDVIRDRGNQKVNG